MRLPHRYAAKVRTWGVLALLLLALAVRGAIPAGYMPTDARSDQAALLSLCVSPGHEASALAMLAGLGGAPGTPEDSAAMQACAFAIVAHQALDLPPPAIGLPALPSGAFHPQPATRQQPGLYVSRTGPPLGARAPPVFFS